MEEDFVPPLPPPFYKSPIRVTTYTLFQNLEWNRILIEAEKQNPRPEIATIYISNHQSETNLIKLDRFKI